ncbi:glyoxalase superfamily protein [Olivibacter ginsenosidimutans]|uniref:Bleomycin resistance protein n=2 Tax=Olivibacter ginsenosidimutans TaxID=1176537 RepID=A0ABP9AQX5_9SPHI
MNIIPILRIFDVEKAKEFYVQWLGFQVDWEHRYGDNFPLYLQISKGPLKIHLSEHYGDGTPGTKVFIDYTDNLENWQQQLLAAQYKYYRPGLEDAPWGAKTMSIIDPFGNTLLFSQQT